MRAGGILGLQPSGQEIATLFTMDKWLDNYKVMTSMNMAMQQVVYNKNMTSGYRPISILPVVTKVIEKHIKKIILDHLTNYAPISPRQLQWEFMETRSTIICISQSSR